MGFDPVEASFAELQAAMEEGRITARELVLLYLKRIAESDKGGLMLNSVLEINPEVLFIADALDAERAEGATRGPLHGIPLLLKDNIDTGDKMHTSAGSLPALWRSPATMPPAMRLLPTNCARPVRSFSARPI